MNRPMCSPCSSGSPQKTGSLAPSTMSGETGTDFCSVFCSGPLRFTSQTPTQSAIQLSMIVVITSLAPVVAFSSPAIPPHSAPAAHAPIMQTRMCSTDGMPSNDEPNQTAT